MRNMYPLIEDCVKSVIDVLIKSAKDRKEVELKKLTGNFTMDVIARCAFATKIDTHNNPDNEFVKNANLVWRGSWRVWASVILLLTFPKLARKLGINYFDKRALNFFKTAVSNILFRYSVLILVV